MPSIYDFMKPPEQPDQNTTSPEALQQIMMQKQQQNITSPMNVQAMLQQKQEQQGGDPSAGILPAGATDVTPMQAKKTPSMLAGVGLDEARFRKLLDQRQNDVQDDRDKLSGLKSNKPSGLGALDLSPAFNFADAMTGSHMEKGYGAPTQIQEWKDKQALLKKAIDDNSNKVNDDVGTILKAKIAEQGALQRSEAMMGRGDGMSMRNQIANDRLGMQVGKKFDDDKVLNNLEYTIQNQSKKAVDLMNSNVPITPQLFADLQMDVNSALSGARSTTGGERDHMMISTAYNKIASLQQQITSSPTEALNPAFRKQLTDTIMELNGTISGLKQRRIDQLASGMDQLSSQSAKNIMNAKVNKLRSSPLDTAPAPQGGGMVTVSNGKETLQVSPADLQHAIADGYKQVQ